MAPLSLSGRTSASHWHALAWAMFLAIPFSLLAQTNLIEWGSTWHYLDDGTDQGTNWLSLNYDDRAWKIGPAELGYGDGDEATLIANLHGSPPTVYFRTKFFVAGNPFQTYTNATVRFIADDGAVVYLNGTELYRHNLSPGNVNYLTEATTRIEGEAERQVMQRSVYRGYMVPGTNILAVSLHQAPAEENDASFDLTLIADLPLTPPTIRLLQPTNGQVFPSDRVWLVPELEDLDGHIYRVDYFANGVSLAEVTAPPFAYEWRGMPFNRRYRLHARAIDHSGRSSFSASVVIQVGDATGILLQRGPFLQMGGTNRMTVKWRTDWFASSSVSYGPSVGAWENTVTNAAPVLDHEVHLTGLQPDRLYYYAIASDGIELAAGDSYHFRTSPMTGKPTRIWVIGDSGTANDHSQSVYVAYESRSGEQETDLWLMLGDNAYEEGTDEQYQRAVFEIYDYLLRRSVLWPTIGNHDASLLQNGQFAYLDIFSLPRQAEAGGVASGVEAYYSFDYGNIHFICLDSQTSDRSTNSAMWTWLEEDLAAATEDWLVAYWHHPPYSKGTHDSDVEWPLIQMRERALPLLERYGVDLVLSGHSHVYERSFLLDSHYGHSTNLHPSMILQSGTGNPATDGAYRKPTGAHGSHRGAVYAVCGCSGEGGTVRMPDHPAMVYSRVGYGSMILEIDGLNLDAQFIDEYGQVHDQFRLSKTTATAADGPRLRIEAAPQKQFDISWPHTLLDHQLEKRRHPVEGEDWVGVTNRVERTGHRNRVIVDQENTQESYRLRAVP